MSRDHVLTALATIDWVVTIRNVTAAGFSDQTACAIWAAQAAAAWFAATPQDRDVVAMWRLNHEAGTTEKLDRSKWFEEVPL